jgi:hypothetical protein
MPPASAPNITEIESFPEPKSIESPLISFAELMTSLPDLRSITQPPVKHSLVEESVLFETFRFNVSSAVLPTIV